MVTIIKKYLQTVRHLLHRDFYPGSWIETKQGLKVIDPEFSFYGLPEFDLAVMLAHLKLTLHSSDLQQQLITFYQKDQEVDLNFIHLFTRVEIFRRLIGLAQLPLKLSLD